MILSSASRCRPAAPPSARACVALALLTSASLLCLGTAGAQEPAPQEARQAVEAQRAQRSSGAPRERAAKAAIEARAEAVTIEAIGAQARRPTGWVIVPSGRGAVATFRASGDREAQIEVRLSGEILAGRAERYAQSFQNQIQGAGFRVETAERDVRIGGRTGDLITYGVDADGQAYRLVTWLHHSEERMWVFSLFCTEARREAYLEVFEELIATMRWSQDAASDEASAENDSEG